MPAPWHYRRLHVLEKSHNGLLTTAYGEKMLRVFWNWAGGHCRACSAVPDSCLRQALGVFLFAIVFLVRGFLQRPSLCLPASGGRSILSRNPSRACCAIRVTLLPFLAGGLDDNPGPKLGYLLSAYLEIWGRIWLLGDPR